MITKITENNYGKMAHCICDRCGKEFIKQVSHLNKKNHYCSRDCSGTGRPEAVQNYCIICHKPKDDTFYDKSARPICSKACYSVYFDNCYRRDVWWERKRPANNMGNNVSKKPVFWKTGRLNCNYNLGVW
jgi:hypothetical protein